MEKDRQATGAIKDYVYTIIVENGVAVATKQGPGCEAVTGYGADAFEKDPELWLSRIPAEDRDRVTGMMNLATAGR